MTSSAATPAPATIVPPPPNGADLDRQRLWEELLKAEGRMLAAQGRSEDTSRCLRWLGLAVREAAAGRPYIAWDNLHQFEIEFLATLDEEGRRLAWPQLAAEAGEKLADWRAKAVEAMRGPANDVPAPSVQLLQEVRGQLAAQAQNSHLKREMLRHRVPVVLSGSLITVAFFVATAYFGWYNSLVPGLALPLRLGVLAAVLGGMISVATSIGTTDLRSKIPHLRHAGLVTALRPAVGALCAIPVVFLVHSGSLKLENVPTLWTVVVLCLITGFSERWFLGVMERVASEAKG